MTYLYLLAVVSGAMLGAVIGTLLPLLFHWLRRPEADVRSSYDRPQHDHLDADLRRHVQDLSAAWAASRGHPGAPFLAAGYLRDAADDLQRRWNDLR